MSSWAPTTDRVVNTSWGRSRGGSAVNGLILHHQADGGGHDAIDYMINWNSRGSHPTYGIDDDSEASVIGIVHPDYSPSSTGYALDKGAVTIEAANTGGAPEWRVSENSLEAIAQIIAHHADESERFEYPVELNEPSRTQRGFWVAWHSQYFATACPGPFLVGKMAWLVQRANEIRDMKDLEPKPTPRPEKGSSGGGNHPKFPLPNDWYFGPENGPTKSVSGRHGNKHGSAEQMRKHLWRWQQRMEDRGWLFPKYGSDGMYGDETRENTIAFQREKGLTVDGLIGPATWNAAWTEPVT